jgi:hypothetical protein
MWILLRMRCILYQFITDYVKDVYVGEKQYEINQQIDSVTKGTLYLIHRFDDYVILPGSLALMNCEPITLRDLLMRARLQDQIDLYLKFDQKVCMT